jgi:hypothetical protein
MGTSVGSTNAWILGMLGTFPARDGVARQPEESLAWKAGNALAVVAEKHDCAVVVAKGN